MTKIVVPSGCHSDAISLLGIYALRVGRRLFRDGSFRGIIRRRAFRFVKGDVIGVLSPQADDPRIMVMKPPPALVPMRQLQAFFTSDPLDLLVIDDRALDAQELADLAVA